MTAAIIVRATDSLEAAVLHDVAALRGWTVIDVVEAGDVGLARIDTLVAEGRVTAVLVDELGRLSHRPVVVLAFLDALEAAGVALYWHSQGFESLTAAGEPDPTVGLLRGLLAEQVAAAADVFQARIDTAHRSGKRFGRPVGWRKSNEALLADHADVVRLLRKGQSVRVTATLTGKAINTVQRVRKILISGNDSPQ